MSLFQKSVEKKYLNELDPALVDKKFNDFQSYFGNTEIQENIRNSKEEEFQEGFIRELFVNILNYTLKPKPGFNIVLEKKNVDDSRKADAAIINNFSTDGMNPTDGLKPKQTDGLTRQLQAIATRQLQAIAVIELKSTSTTDLDTVETQAFGYKNHHPNCVYVITSNFEKLRFYIHNAVDYLEFDLFNLSKEQFSLLWLCLSKDNILKDLPLRIKESSVLQEENVTKQLYADYSKFREAIFENIVKNNSSNINNGVNPVVDPLTLFKKTQKLLDRFLFIFFAEDRLLLPPNSISEIIKQWTTLKEDLDAYVPLYERFKKYFDYMNTGFKGKKYDIFPYNGGLFFPDEILDNITIDDNILHEHTLKLSAYDFETDVDVNILGHIFEHSLAEIENVQAKLRGEHIDKQKTKRKKDGIFYTPKYITKYIVENTVGKLCEEKRNELEIIDEEYAKGRKNRKKDTIKSLDKKLNAYRNWLLSLTILDPACGSGAFLNQALEFLINEHKKIDELRAQLFGGGIVFSDITNEILEKNIYGVDLNEESVDIAKLSLWLRTARKGRKLNTLSNNIKCGNSLIDDPEVAGEKAFNWQKEFPHIFEKKEKKSWHVVFAIHNSRYVKLTDGLTRRFVHRFEPGFIAYTYPKLNLHEEEILADCLNEVVKEKQLNILACNICEDHVHAIIVCEKEELEKNIGQWKGRTAYLYNRRVNPSIDDQQPEYADGTKQKLWAKSFHPVEITDDTQMQNTLHYIKNNREKHELPAPTDGLTRRLKEMTCTPEHAFRTEYKGGFDVVIGNPPYTYRNAITKEEKKYYKKKYESIKGNFDLYKIFIERIVNINKDNGYASFIIPNTFLTAKTYKKLREILINNFAILEFFDLGLDVFENVVVESIIFKLKKIQTPNQITEIKIQRDRSRYFKYLQDNYNIDLLKYSGDDFLFNTNISTKISPIIDKMFNDIKLLGKLCYCTVGINTGYIKSELTSEYKIDVRYHKMLNGKNIGRNFIDWDNEWIMYDIDFVKSQGERGRALPPEYIFLNDKILVQRTRRGMKRKLVCYYDNEQFYNLNRLSNIVLENNNYSLKYIYSLLNSTLMDFFFNNFFNEYEVKPSHLAKLPIKETENQQPFIEKADLMLSLNKELQTKAGKFIKRIKANLNPAVYHIPNSGVNPAAERLCFGIEKAENKTHF
jgi:type I restriction-modification system DNA methylase subunit/REP element-mobilizing transposase RayT